MKKLKSFKTKLWMYFVLFTAIIFSVLWLMQTVLLQTFYNQMLISNTKTAVDEIINNADNDNLMGVIDEIARNNSLLIYVTDQEGNFIYAADEYKNSRKDKHSDNGMQEDDKDILMADKHLGDDRGFTNEGEELTDRTGESSGKLSEDNGVSKSKDKSYRSLPEDYSGFLDSLNESENGVIEYQDKGEFIYGTYIEGTVFQGKAVLYVAALLGAVGSAASIIRIQLIIVTTFSLLVGFALAWLIARRFSRPVLQLSDKAVKLGEDDYSEVFDKGFCLELDELNDTLDLTDKKLRQSRTFQSELLANVSHDLRTPLTMIKGYAEEVGEYSWQDEQQRKSDIAVIVREADRLTALVNEILEYSELQANGNTKDFQTVDLSMLVSRTAETFHSLYSREGYEISCEIENDITVIGSASQLERVVINLLDNAIRHTGNNKKVSVSLHREKPGIVLKVTDYGKGIPISELDHIWDRYYTSRQRNGQGSSGLGLAIVKQIVTLHGGNCKADSIPGDGSTFIIELPEKST